jgi:hypothetical protein
MESNAVGQVRRPAARLAHPPQALELNLENVKNAVEICV